MQPTLGVGIFSGLNITELVTGLLSIERRPLQNLSIKQSSNEAKISALGSLKSNLSSLNGSLDKLKSDAFFNMKASSSDSNIFSASADSNALAGSYNIKVSRLATSQTLVSNPFAQFSSEVADLTTNPIQKIKLQLGEQSKEITIDSNNNSMEKIRDEINAAGVGIQASLVNYGFTVDSSNKDLVFSVDGLNKTATLTEGTYTADELAAEMTRAMETANDNADTYGISYDSSTYSFSVANDSGNAATLDILAEDSGSTLVSLIGLDATDHVALSPGQSLVADSAVGGNRLVLSTSLTGSANRMQISVDEDNDGIYEEAGDADSLGLSQLAFNPSYDVNGNVLSGINNLDQTQIALDALITVDGVDASRSNNSISDLIPNVTLNLKKADVGTSVALTIEKDMASVVSNIRGFVAAYNDVAGLARGLSEIQDDQRALLTGDTVVRGIINQLRSSLISKFGDFSAAQLGLSHDDNGLLTLNETILDGFLETDFSAVQKSFDGFAESLETSLESFVNTNIPTRIEGLESANKRIEDSMSAIQRRLILKEDVLIERFSILEKTLGQLQSSSDFLSQQLKNIASISNSRGVKS